MGVYFDKYKDGYQDILGEIRRLSEALTTGNGRHPANFADSIAALISKAYRTLNADTYYSVLKRIDDLLEKVSSRSIRLSLQISVYKNMLELGHISIPAKLNLWLKLAQHLQVLGESVDALYAARTARIIGKDLDDTVSQIIVEQAQALCYELDTSP